MVRYTARMQSRPRRLIATAVFVTVFAFAAVAFAQPAPGPMPAPTLTPTVAVVTALSMLAGLLTNWIQTGTFLGRWVTPKTWLPDLTMISTALGGFLGYITSQAPVTFTGTNLFYGIMAAITALIAGAAPSLAIHAHSTLPEQRRAALALAKSIATTAAKAAAVLIMIGGLVSSQTACNGGAAWPIMSKVVQVVENDLKTNVSETQMASDVCQALGGNAPTDAICAAVPGLIQDVIALLMDGGTLPPAALVRAQSYMAAHPKAAPAAGPVSK